MRRLGNVIRRTWMVTCVAVLGMMTLNSCLKDDQDGVFQVSAVRALNAVPGMGQLDIGLNDSWLNYDPQTDRVENFAYRDTLPYKRAWPGMRLVRVFKRGDISDKGLLAKENAELVPGEFYSVFVVGKEDDVDLITVRDDLTDPVAGKAKIRFANLSPDAPAVDFHIGEMDTVIASDIAFKDIEGFSSIEGGKAYTFHISKHSNDRVLYTFQFTPLEGMIYTIWLGGLVESEGNADVALNHDMIVH